MDKIFGQADRRGAGAVRDGRGGARVIFTVYYISYIILYHIIS